MKKLYFLLISLLIVFTIQAQRFNGGVMVGFTGSQVAGDNDSGYNKAGLFGGGFVNLEIGSRSLLQLELEFMQKGSRHNPNYEEGDFKSLLMRLAYVEMPLLFQYIVSDKFKIEAGPSLAVLIDSFEEYDGQEGVRENFRLMHLCINAGVYYSLTDKFLLNFRTNNSLINIRNQEVTGDVFRLIDHGQYNDVLTFSVFYNFK